MKLASALAESRRTILQTLAETILEVTGPDSAGVSLLTTEDGRKRFYVGGQAVGTIYIVDDLFGSQSFHDTPTPRPSARH